MFPWSFSIFKGGFRDTHPSPVSLSSAPVVRRLFERPPTKPASYFKRRLPCWSPAIYQPSTTRKNDNVTGLTAVVLDVDDGSVGPTEASHLLQAQTLNHAVYSTWNHSLSRPKYRVVIFVNRVILPHEFTTLWCYAQKILGHVGDQKCKDLARFYALPARRRKAEEYIGNVWLDGQDLDVDRILIDHKVNSPKQNAQGARSKSASADPDPPISLTNSTPITLDSGKTVTPEMVIKAGEAKYRCFCPWEKGASAGSAFLRILGDGRCFLRCTSTSHTHTGQQWWVNNSVKSTVGTRSVSERGHLIAEVPPDIVRYVEASLAYNVQQQAFFRRQQGMWLTGSAMRKHDLTDHLVGLLPEGCGQKHAVALVDHVLSRQAYGYDVVSEGLPIVSREGQRMMNLYAEPKLKPKPHPFPTLKAMLYVLAGGDPKVERWLTHWSAALTQAPERRGMVAVLCMSPQQGIGKSMYGRVLSHIIGEGNTAVVSNRALRDNFNASYVTSLFILADEVGIHPAARDVVAEIKTYITDEEVHLAAPYAARTKTKNRMTWWMTSNELRPMLIEQDDRRMTVLACGQASLEYKLSLRDSFDARAGVFTDDFRNEVAGFAHALRKLKVDWSLVSKPINTSAKSLLLNASLGSLEAFRKLMLETGISNVTSSYPPGHEMKNMPKLAAKGMATCQSIYSSYKTWCQRHGRRDERPEAEFQLVMLSVDGIKVKRVYSAGQYIDVYHGLPTGPDRQKAKARVINLH